MFRRLWKGKSAAKKTATKSTTNKAAKNTAVKKTASKSKSAPKRKPSAKKATAKKTAAVKKKPAARKKAVAKKPVAKRKVSAKKKAAPKKAATRTAKKKAVPKKKTVAKKAPSKKKVAKRRPAAKKARPAKKKPVARKRAPKTIVSSGGGHRPFPQVKPPFEAYKGERPYIFTSYAHKNMQEVFSTIKKLNESRYRLWYDEGIEPGNEWPEIVGRAVLRCSQFLVFMSKAATQSRNVRNEINLAFSENKEILVVFLEKTNLTEGMKLQIGTVQFINKFEMRENEFIEKLKKVLSSDLRN